MRDRSAASIARGVALAGLLAHACGPTSAGEPVTIHVDPNRRHQTMVGWEAVAQAGQESPGFALWSERLFDLAVDDLGIDRLRVELRSGTEIRSDLAARHEIAADPRCRRYFTINDNDDPGSIDWSGFDFTSLDDVVRRVVLPMKRRLEARGERLYVNLEYVAFVAQCEGPFDYVHARPEEYAELVLAAFLHLRERFDLVPDGLEIILEPDNVPGWSGTRIGEAMVHAAERLATAGFRPELIAPATTSLAAASEYVDAIVAVPGAGALLREISYHRYRGVSRKALEALARRAAQLGVRTAMLEKIGADVDTLYDDLTLGNVSAWQQFTLAFPTKDNGAQYYRIVDGRPELGRRTRYLRQYFRHVRRGAVRIGTASEDGRARALAFLDPGGRAVVVVHVGRAVDLVVRGLPAGTYGASLTTDRQLGAELGPIAVGDEGVARVRVPGSGVLAIHPR